MAPSTLTSPAVTLNPSKNVPEGVHHLFQVAGNLLEKDQPFKSPDQGMGLNPTWEPSMTSPTSPHIYKKVLRPGRSEYSQQWPSAPPPSFPALQKPAGTIALREVLSRTPSKLLPPYPCIGHHSLPFPSAVKFWHASSPNPANRSPPWPSKGPACCCLW